MGDKMKFPNEVWISERLRGGYYVVDFIIEADEDDRVRYIRADLVPISCGGTMEENDSNALARAEITEWPGRKI
jgi:hypothetical protein